MDRKGFSRRNRCNRRNPEVRDEEHLSSQELDQLVSRQASASDEETSSVLVERARAHLEICRACRALLSRQEGAEREIRGLGGKSQSEPDRDCPERSELLEVAAGIITGRRREELMEHVVSCDHCGPVFRQAIAVFSDDVTQDEQSVLASVKSAQPKWQSRMSQIFSDTGESRQIGGARGWWSGEIFSWPRLSIAAGLGFSLVASWLGLLGLRRGSANELLAQAYTERRTFEVRIPGAKYAPLRVERSNGGSNLDKPEALLKAEALI